MNDCIIDNGTEFCYPKSLVFANEFLDTTENPGSSIAGFNSFFLAVYILFSITLYNFRGFWRDKKTMQLTLTPTQRSINGIYLIALIIFEIYWIYGHRFSDGVDDNVPSPTILIAIFWMICNLFGSLSLCFGFCSKQKVRIYMYNSIVYHVPFFMSVILERFLFRDVAIDILIPFILFILALIQTILVPSVFKLDKAMIEHLTEQATYNSDVKSIMMENKINHKNLNEIDSIVDKTL